MEGTIIIADDDVSIRTVLTQAVSRAGCRVKSTGAISTLWRWIEEGEGDAIILDVVLPDGDALDILPALKKKRPDVTKRMGYMKKGGMPKKMMGGGMMDPNKKMMGGGMMGYKAGGSPGVEVLKMPQEIPTPKLGQPLTVAAKGHKGYNKKVTIT